MPLGFPSQNYGVIAFGFFHIETHLLLLQENVFWCRDFCELITDLANTQPHKLFQARLKSWRFTSLADLGDLHGSIAGRSHYGLIGELYQRWPFPEDMAAFKQKALGIAPKSDVQGMLDRLGRARELEVRAHGEEAVLGLGKYQFDAEGTRALTDYVWRGGMPGWLDGERPDYIWEAAAGWRKAINPLLTGMSLDAGEVGVSC